MGRHGENIHKRKDGRWEGRCGQYDENRKRTVYHSVYGKTYADVKEKLNVYKKNAMKESTDIETKNIMFPDVAVKWFDQVKESNKYSTFVKYRYIYNKYLKESMADIKIQEIDAAMLNKQIEKGESTGKILSESQQKNIFSVTNQILLYGAEQYHMPVAKIKRVSKNKSTKKIIEIFSQSEQAKLICYLYQDMDIYKLGILLCLSVGLRLGEVCAVKWEDIDLNQKILSVERTVQRIAVDDRESKTILMESLPKSEYSKREIPISDHMTHLLSCNRKDHLYFLCKDKPMEPRTYQNKFKVFLKDAGVSERNFHVLRHTFATNCINNGTDIKSLSEILGHSDVQITLNRYVHPTMDTKRKYMDSLSSIYGQYCGQ